MLRERAIMGQIVTSKAEMRVKDKVGILVFLAGIVILLVSIIRERIFIRRRERYKEVEK